MVWNCFAMYIYKNLCNIQPLNHHTKNPYTQAHQIAITSLVYRRLSIYYNEISNRKKQKAKHTYEKKTTWKTYIDFNCTTTTYCLINNRYWNGMLLIAIWIALPYTKCKRSSADMHICRFCYLFGFSFIEYCFEIGKFGSPLFEIAETVNNHSTIHFILFEDQLLIR